MSLNINEFRSQLQYDGARPNLFNVYMTFPALVNASAGIASTKITYMAKGSSLPGDTMGFVSLPYQGREIKVPGNRTFTDWQITVINDEDFVIRNAFESWLSLLNSHAGNIRDPNMINAFQYSVDATIVQLDKTGQPIKQYDFVGMFPVDVSPIDLDWSSNDNVEEFSVTLSYQYWTSIFPVATTDTDGLGQVVF